MGRAYFLPESTFKTLFTSPYRDVRTIFRVSTVMLAVDKNRKHPLRCTLY